MEEKLDPKMWRSRSMPSWSVRELKRQIDGSLYERLLLPSGDANKEKVLSLAQKGIEINQPADIIRDPCVFEFLGVQENRPVLESDLEKDSNGNE